MRYFIWYAILHYYSFTFHNEILYFSLHYIYLGALVTFSDKDFTF